MVAPVKTTTTLQAWATVATANALISTVLNAAESFAANFHIELARASGSAFSAGQPRIRIECSPLDSGNSLWTEVPGGIIIPPVGASIVNTTLNGVVSAGATSCVVTSASNIAAGDILFLGDASSANYELVRVKSVASTTVTFEEACTYGHTTGAAVTDQALRITVPVDCSAGMRYRAVVENHSGQSCHIKIVASAMTGVE